jgi:O-antigen ligase
MMSQYAPIVLIAFLAITLWRQLCKDFIGGLSFAVFVWVSMTTFLRISLGGVLPELTIHRLLLIVVIFAWSRRHSFSEIRSIPLIGCFAFWIVANVLSLAGTQIDFIMSLKRFLDFVLELFAFYAVASTSLESQEDVRRVLKGAWLGLIFVAVLAVIERYTLFNPVDRFIPGYVREDVAWRDVLSTYQHRILLGTAMAMGVPLTFLLRRMHEGAGERFRYTWPAAILFVATCYFAFSRGPWMSLILAAGIMFALGSPKTRKALSIIAVLAVFVMILRPGVLETLGGFAKDTADADSFKGGTFQYRLELWRVAWNQISSSAWRTLCGFGPGAGGAMQIQWDISYRGKTQTIESWDNHFAYSMFQGGIIGLLATLLLFFTAIKHLWKGWQRSPRELKDIYACLLATAMVQIFMMTNVLIFAKQLDYLFWAVIACGIAMQRCAETSNSQVLEPESETEWMQREEQPVHLS